jgi:hypothetical protein
MFLTFKRKEITRDILWAGVGWVGPCRTKQRVLHTPSQQGQGKIKGNKGFKLVPGVLIPNLDATFTSPHTF